MFTADPVTGHRNIISIDASFGLGEALVSGIVSADSYKVRRGQIIKKQIAEKKKAVYPTAEGGTEIRELAPELQNKQALSDDKILELAQIGQRIEDHYCSKLGVEQLSENGIERCPEQDIERSPEQDIEWCPEQDIEWCLVGDRFYILQSRPITSLYPVPEVYDNKFHVFLSIAHMQMMTDAMRPMGVSIFQGMLPYGKDPGLSPNSVMVEAGGRLFFDVTPFLHNKLLRRFFIWRTRILDELMGDALEKNTDK
nr:PEP/pyruvate-binding domain-containing protein [Methanosarcina horonobensis]